MPGPAALNVFGRPLASCSVAPMTGWFRDGCCHTDPQDRGLHVVCIVATADFLAFSRARGNDLSTPRPDLQFPGLKPGDHAALVVGLIEKVLEATHLNALGVVGLDQLKAFAVDAPAA